MTLIARLRGRSDSARRKAEADARFLAAHKAHQDACRRGDARAQAQTLKAVQQAREAQLRAEAA